MNYEVLPLASVHHNTVSTNANVVAIPAGFICAFSRRSLVGGRRQGGGGGDARDIPHMSESYFWSLLYEL